MPLTPKHPSWCEYPSVPADSTHTHTATMGTIRLDGPTTVELVLIQPPGEADPMLTVHVVTLVRRLSFDLNGTQAWGLAGLLIDATVAHSQASAKASTSGAELALESHRPNHSEDRLWLLDRHPNGRMPRARTRRFVRCSARRRPKIDDAGSGDTGVAE